MIQIGLDSVEAGFLLARTKAQACKSIITRIQTCPVLSLVMPSQAVYFAAVK